MVLGLQFLEEYASRSKDDPMCMETVKDIKSSCNLALRTLDEMLTVDKIESGYFSATKQEIYFLKFMQSEIKLFQNQVKDERITLTEILI